MDALLLLPILIPILCGVLLWILPVRSRRTLHILSCSFVLGCAILCAALLATLRAHTLTLFSLPGGICFQIGIDGMGAVFAGIVIFFWVCSTIYAVGNMPAAGDTHYFHGLFQLAMGLSVGIALAGNLFTLYLFYQALSFFTYPLIRFYHTPEALLAGKKYLRHAYLGAGLCLVNLILVVTIAPTATFQGQPVPGGSAPDALLQAAFLAGFLGFGVQAAIFPLHSWLPSAHEAPMPVTTVLHAVTVVKAGVFGILRLAYQTLPIERLAGSWVQFVCVAMLCISVAFSSIMALNTTHLKERLAYSTMSQLSCMLFPALLFTAQGQRSTLVYMVMHATIKTVLFLCCGVIAKETCIDDVRLVRGLGRKMPFTMVCFTIASLALIGLPFTAGFISKWYLALAAFGCGSMALGALGAGLVICSTLFSGLYLLPLCYKAFLPPEAPLPNCSDPSRSMALPILVLTALIFILGIFPTPILAYIASIGG